MLGSLAFRKVGPIIVQSYVLVLWYGLPSSELFFGYVPYRMSRVGMSIFLLNCRWCIRPWGSVFLKVLVLYGLQMAAISPSISSFFGMFRMPMLKVPGSRCWNLSFKRWNSQAMKLPGRAPGTSGRAAWYGWCWGALVILVRWLPVIIHNHL